MTQLYDAASIQVKPLVWNKSSAPTIYGSYFVEHQGHEYVCFFIPPTATSRERHWELLDFCDDQQSGMDLCQHEHDRRVRALLG